MTLWKRHYYLLGDLYKLAKLDPQTVAAVIVGCQRPQGDFDAVLAALNTLAGTHYTLDEIAGIKLSPSLQSKIHEEGSC